MITGSVDDVQLGRLAGPKQTATDVPDVGEGLRLGAGALDAVSDTLGKMAELAGAVESERDNNKDASNEADEDLANAAGAELSTREAYDTALNSGTATPEELKNSRDALDAAIRRRKAAQERAARMRELANRGFSGTLNGGGARTRKETMRWSNYGEFSDKGIEVFTKEEADRYDAEFKAAEQRKRDAEAAAQRLKEEEKNRKGQ